MFSPSPGLCMVLDHQHQRIETLLYPLLAPQMDWTGDVATNRFAAMSGLLRRHMDIEDHVLFPIYERLAPARDQTVAATLRSQHRELEWGLDYLWSMITGGANPAAIRRHLGSFDNLLARHIEREHWVVFATYQQLAPNDLGTGAG